MVKLFVAFMTRPITDPVFAFGYRIWLVAGIVSFVRFITGIGLCH